MNHVMIIGNLTADPEMRTTQTGKKVVTFTVAVNRRQSAQAGQPEADFFRVSAWNQLGEICEKYLAKGRKCAVTGSIRAGAYINSHGKAVGTLEVMADNVEFLSSRHEQQPQSPVNASSAGHGAAAPQPQQGSMLKQSTGFVQVEDEDLPF